jgi:hypothetical protein
MLVFPLIQVLRDQGTDPYKISYIFTFLRISIFVIQMAREREKYIKPSLICGTWDADRLDYAILVKQKVSKNNLQHKKYKINLMFLVYRDSSILYCAQLIMF